MIENGLLIPLLLCGGILFIGMYAWYFIFGRSSRAVLMAFLGVLLSREDTIDIENLENTPTNKRASASDKFDAQADSLKSQWQGQAIAPDEPPLPHAKLPPTEQGSNAPTTHHIGWPRALDPEEAQSNRPFLQSRLESDSDGGLNDATSDVPDN